MTILLVAALTGSLGEAQADPDAADAATLPPHPLALALSATPSEGLPEAVTVADPVDLEAALPFLDGAGAAAGWSALRLGRLYMHRRRFREAEDFLEFAAQGDAVVATRAKASLERLHLRSQSRPNRIGALLPLTGPYGQIGRTAKEAIELALVDTGIELVLADTGGDAVRAPVALESLVYDKHVAAVIGPVGSIESLAAARTAERLEVPIVVLSSREKITRVGTFVFRHRLTRGNQAEAIARHAIEELGFRRFGILYPKSRYGREMMTSFWRTVERLGGEVRAAQGYSVHDRKVSDPIKRMIGRYYIDDREVDPHWESLNRKSKDKSLHVPPVVEFEALFIPDSGRRLRRILPFLAYWDIELKTDPVLSPLAFSHKYGGAVPQLVQVLGGSGFNDQRLVDRPLSQAAHSVFVDAFWPNAAGARVFVDRWRARNQRPPPALAAHAYDAAQLLARAVKDQQDRGAVRRALLGIRDHAGVFGPTRIEGDGEITYGLHVLTLDPDAGITPYQGITLEEMSDEDAPM